MTQPFLKAYCYLKDDLISTEGPLECAEVSFQATPDILRQLADFMIKCAEKIEMSKGEMQHVHLQDEWKKWNQDYPDVIAVSPPKESL